MPKTATPRTNMKTSRAAKKAAAVSAANIPPLAAAIACLADPELGELPSEFIAAYRQMPAFVAALLNGTADDIGTVGRYSLMRELTKADIASARTDDGNHRIAEAFDLLTRTHEDYLSCVECSLGNNAFWIGVAYAAFLLTEKGGA